MFANEPVVAVAFAYAIWPCVESAIMPRTPVSSTRAVVGAPTGSAKARRVFEVDKSSATSDDGVGNVGKSNWTMLEPRLVGVVPATGYGADCNVPAPVDSLTALSQYQRAPSGDA